MTHGTFYIAILHYPVYDKNREIVTTSITPIDVHDLARAAKTYGVRRCFIVTPLKSQRRLIQLIVDHWATGYGATYNATRREAMEVIDISPRYEDMIAEITREWGRPPKTVATSARLAHHDLDFEGLRERILAGKDPYLVLFGTGWGLVEETIRAADFRLEPLRGPTDYNHLSVRSAASIVMDRVMGTRCCGEREQGRSPGRH